MDAERTGHVRKEAEPNDPATRQGCQGLPAAARGPERRGGQAFGGSTALLTPGLRLLTPDCDRVSFCWLKMNSNRR